MPRNNLQRNADYWAQRMKNMEDALLDQSYSYVENLDAQFRAAEAEIERQMSAWYRRFAANNDITLADAKRLLNSDELAEFRWTVEDYIKHGEENALTGAWMKELENASARVHISRLDALKIQLQQQAELLYSNQLDYIDRAARQSYTGSFYHTAYEVQKGLGVGWTMQAVNEGTITKVLSRPWTTDGQTFRDRCWTNKQSLVNSVNTQLTQMIIRGEAPDRAISAISKQFEVSRSKAGRLVMTESAYFSSAAQKDCFNALGVEKYRIVASFDRDTCGLCSALDGKVFKMSDYQVGLTAPPFHPWCRCCTAPYFEDMEGLGERWTRNPDGTTKRSRPTPPLPNGGRVLCRAQPPVYRCPPGVVQWPQRRAPISRMSCRACPHPPAVTRTPWSNIMRPAIRRPRPPLSAMSSLAPWRTGLSPARRILTAASKRSK